MHEELLQAKNRLHLVNTIARGLLGRKSVDDIIRITLEHISVGFPSYRIAYRTVDRDGQATVIQSIEPSGMPALAGLTADLGKAPRYLEALRAGASVIVRDIAQDSRMKARAEEMAAGATRAVLDVPLHRTERLVGLLCFDSPAVRDWTEHEVATLREVADCLSVALQHAQGEHVRRMTEEKLQTKIAELRTTL